MATRARIDYVRFFKVPFDNTYKNVYNFQSTDSTEIYAWLESNFSGLGWDIYNATKGITVKVTNGRCTLSYTDSGVATAGVVSWYQIKNYNYCALRYKTATSTFYQFYFVTGYSTLNQGSAPTTNISLEYDVWTNNFATLSALTDDFTQVQGHILDVQKTSLIYHKYISESMPELRTKYERINNGKRILWLKLKLRSSYWYYVKNDNSWVKTQVASANASCSQMPIVYAPVGVYDSKSQVFDDIEYTLYDKNSNSVPIKKLDFQLAQTGDITSAEFTFYPPFAYTLTPGTTNYTLDTESVQIRSIWAKYTSEGSDSYQSLTGYSVVTGNSTLHQPVYSAKTQVATIVPKFTTSVQYAASGDYNPATIGITSYPNDYYEVQTGGAKYKIVPPQDTISTKVFVYVIDEYVAFSVAYYGKNDTLIYESRRIPLPNCGYLTIVSDSESLFYRNQGNQLTARQQNASTQYQVETLRQYAKLTTAAVGIAAGSGAGVALAGSTILSQYGTEKSLEMQNNTINAIRADAANYLDSATNINNDALLALCEQNQVIVNHYSPVVSDYDYEKAKLNIYKYGRATNVASNINDLPHKIFNYKRFSDYELPSIYNIQERNEIISILKSGVTIWNASTGGSDTEKEAVKTMTKICNNPCVEVI